MWTTDDYIAHLPDSYRKDADGNNYKLLSIDQRSIEEYAEAASVVDAYADITKATGATLDLFGELANVKRGTMTDEQYRYAILTVVARQFCSGTFESVSSLLAIALSCSASDFSITEGDCSVTFEQMPMAVILSAGLTVEQLNSTIKALLPVGVLLEPFTLQGTFEFSASADEYDEAAGFGDVDQTIGGTLGAFSSGYVPQT